MPAVLVIGLTQTSIPSAYGAPLLVSPDLVLPFTLPAGTTILPLDLKSSGLAGKDVYAQLLQLDLSAPRNVAFSKGLHLKPGFATDRRDRRAGVVWGGVAPPLSTPALVAVHGELGLERPRVSRTE